MKFCKGVYRPKAQPGYFSDVAILKILLPSSPVKKNV